MNFLYVKSKGIEGDWRGGWCRELDPCAGLPTASSLLSVVDAYPIDGNKLGLLLEDAALYPLRISLEQKPSSGELDQFILWKLKRFLPYPIEETEMRHLPLVASNTYLTFSLHKKWLNRLFEGFSERGRQLGYIGGLFSTLLENQRCFRGRKSIALFDDSFVFADLDSKGNYLDFRTRRLPLLHDGRSIDLDTLIHTDWKPLTDDEIEPLYLLDFRETRSDTGELWDALADEGLDVSGSRPEGPVLARFSAWMKEGSP